MEASDEGIDTILAEQKLDEARDKLTTALASFESGDFEDAEVLADEAKELAEDAKELVEELTDEAEEEIELEGTVQTGSITVDGIDGSFTLIVDGDTFTILTNENTEFEGFDDLIDIDGLEVEVEAVPSNGDLLATEIELEEVEESEEKEHEEEEDAEDAIADAQKEIDKAREKIDEATEKGKETSLAEQQLDEAVNKLEMAQQSFDLGNFEESEELAEEAEDLASEAGMKLIGKTLEALEEEVDEEEEEEVDEEEDNDNDEEGDENSG